MIMHANMNVSRSPIAIFGWGLSGQGAASLADRMGMSYEVFDQNSELKCRHDFTSEDASRYEMIVCSPGFASEHPWLSLARKGNCDCVTEIEFASRYWQGPLVAVTGTNGKTTVSSFLAYALRSIGKPAVATGNIGNSFSRLLEIEFDHPPAAVCEISSFQAELLDSFRPDVLIWTNFSEDHIDRHGSLQAYFEAKWRLVEMMGAYGMIVVGSSVAEAAERYGYKLPPRTVIVEKDMSSPLRGSHVFELMPQRENYRLIEACWKSMGYAVAKLENAAKTFRLPKHRLAKVAERGELSYWNDSKATNFASALAAIRAVPGPVYWIGGGKMKGGDINKFARAIAPHITEACLIGESAGSMCKALEEYGIKASDCVSMEGAMASLSGRVTRGSVLLSPGFASFDQFPNYTARGNCFEKCVKDTLSMHETLLSS